MDNLFLNVALKFLLTWPELKPEKKESKPKCAFVIAAVPIEQT